MRTREQIEACAAEAGITELLEIGEVEIDGEIYPYFAIEGETGWRAARFLEALVRWDARDPEVADLASKICRGLKKKDESRALHAFVKRAIRFVPEGIETFQAPMFTVRRGAGDCDCHAILLSAMAGARGLPAQLAYLDQGGQPGHVFTCFHEAGMWTPAETTIAAHFGEPPLEAAKRLGISARPDLLGRPLTSSREPLSIGGVSIASAIGETSEMTPRLFAHRLLARLGAPVTTSNVQAVIAWEALEGGHWHNGARYNPLNTSYAMHGSRIVVPFPKGGGIRAYASWSDGIEATARTIAQDDKRPIRVALAASKDPAATLRAIDSTNWGTHGFDPDDWRSLQAYADKPDAIGGLGSIIKGMFSVAMLAGAAVVGRAAYREYVRR